MRENLLEKKGGVPEDPAEYLLDMLLALARVARASKHYFLAFLIEMAALEAAQIKDGSSDGDD
jgi:hypothetical protein